MTYEQAVREWMAERESSGYVLPFTAKKSAEKARAFVPYFGNRELDEVNPVQIARALSDLHTHGGRDGNGISTTTMRAMHLAGRQVFEWAVSYELCETNPFRKVPRPRAQPRQTAYLIEEGASEMATKAESYARESAACGMVQRASFAMAVMLGLATGMRRGEIFALRHADIDHDQMRISVRSAVKAGGELGAPKSASGVRSVAIGAHMLDVLAWHREHTRGPYVICDESGHMASMSTFEHWWRKWADGLGHEGLRFHDLRHTHATSLIHAGVDVKTVQTRLGHSSPVITMSVYAHAIPAADRGAANTFDNILFGGGNA